MGKGGIRMVDVPLMDELAGPNADLDPDNESGEIWLTDPNNLIWGVRREIEVFSRFNQKTDSVEYTVYTRVAAAVEEHDAIVVASNVATTAASA